MPYLALTGLDTKSCLLQGLKYLKEVVQVFISAVAEDNYVIKVGHTEGLNAS